MSLLFPELVMMFLDWVIAGLDYSQLLTATVAQELVASWAAETHVPSPAHQEKGYHQSSTNNLERFAFERERKHLLSVMITNQSLATLLLAAAMMAVCHADVVRINDVDQYKTTMEIAARERQLVILYFSASWCPPCRALQPVVDAYERNLAEQYGNHLLWLQIDVDEVKSAAEEYGVEAMPTIFLVRDKKNNLWEDKLVGDTLVWDPLKHFKENLIPRIEKQLKRMGVPKIL